MDELLTERFEENRNRLRGVAYRMLGSLPEADDAVQEAWIRLSRSDASEIDNLGGWLTTVVARVCLDMLRSREARREDPLDFHVPDPIVSSPDSFSADHDAILADSVGLALIVVLQTLTPAERLAFVLHDMFDLPFEEIATIVGRSPAAARQLASRARRRVQGAKTSPLDTDRDRQREVVEAFLAASRGGDFEALLNVLDPDVVLRLDRGAIPGASKQVRGAANVANLGFRFQGPGWIAHPALVNGAPGIVITFKSRPMSVIGFDIADGRVTGIDILADPARLRGLDTSFLPPFSDADDVASAG